MNSLIPSDNLWLMWTIVIVMAAFAIFSEQKFKWGAFLGSAVVAIFSSMILVNVNLIPSSSPVYSAVGGYILPLSIPLLLFKCDLRKIIRESGRSFIIYHVSAVGTLVGAAVAGFVFATQKGVPGIAAMSTGGFIGGTVNIIAMGDTFKMDPYYINAVAVTANLLLAFVMLILGTGGNFKKIRKHYKHPYIEEFEKGGDKTKSLAAQYWKPKNISLISMSLCLATTFVITGTSQTICAFVNGTDAPGLVKQLFGSIYLVMTLITVILVTAFPKYFEKLEGAEEMGNFMIVAWFVTLGCAATFSDVLSVGYVVFFMAIVIFFNILITFTAGKLFKWNYEELAVSSCATIGGPTTAAALAINKGWGPLVVPGILVGLYGYIIGNYFGVVVGNLLM